MELFRNRAWATLSAGMDAVQTTLPLSTGQGARFGTIAASNKIRLVILDASLNVAEIVYMTAISGDVGTIVRAQDGTSATTHLSGARVEHRAGKSTLEAFMQAEDIQAGAETFLGSVVGTDTITASATPNLTAQAVAGSSWRLTSVGANTGAVTLNINGRGAVAVGRPDGTALQAGDIPAAGYICLIVKGLTSFLMLNPANLIAQQRTNAQEVSSTTSQSQLGTAYATGGTSAAYTITPTPAIAANAENLMFMVEFHTANAVNATLAVSGKAALALRFRNAAGTRTALAASMIPAGWRSRVVHDGTYWLVLDMPYSACGDYQEFTASGTWVRPAGLTNSERIIVEVWGGGGGGCQSYADGGGGGGGGYCRREFPASALLTNSTVTIGAGGAAGVAGGTTTFGTGGSLVRAYGGGTVSNGPYRAGGGGGGTVSVGVVGGPSDGGAGGTGYSGTGSVVSGTHAPYPDVGGTGGASSAGPGGKAFWGGGGGGGGVASTTGGAGGNSTFGGGGGGGGLGGTAGVSLHGGNGGGGTGGNGVVPGGGGGSMGAGADGLCRVWVIR